MTASIQAKSNGTQGALQVNGVDAVVFDSTGVVSGVNKTAVSQMPTLGTAVPTTSGTSIDFTGIPSWVKRITVMFNGVSTNGTSNPLVQLGTGGAPTTTGYSGSAGQIAAGSAGAVSLSTGFFAAGANVTAATTLNGILNLVHMGANIWACFGVTGRGNTTTTDNVGGAVTLSGTLNMLRLTTVGGTDTFDAGSVNIMYE